MSRPIHLIASPSVSAGYGLSDGRCLPCPGVSGSIISISSSSSRVDYNSFPHFKTISLMCASRSNSSIFSFGNYRRDPNTHRQNKHAFSQFHNAQNEDDDGSSDDLEESEHFSSKNGSLISSKPQFRSAPGPKDKEVIELFRKVQAQLRAKAIDKKEEKIEDSPKPKKESNNAVSLLKLLKKYSILEENIEDSLKLKKESNNAVSLLKVLKKYSAPQRDSSSSGTLKGEVGKREPLSASSLISNFRPRSSSPPVRYQPNNYNDESVDSDETEPEPVLLNRAIFEEISDDETFESDEEDDSEDDDDDDDGEEQNNVMMIESRDFSTMKLTELRALAKSRGIKGFSKMKKSKLTELLSGGSV